MLEPRPDWSPLGFKFNISNEHPRYFYIEVPPGGGRPLAAFKGVARGVPGVPVTAPL